jgi:hypothetical protein
MDGDPSTLTFIPSEFTDTVQFEIPDLIAARGLLVRLARTRPTWLDDQVEAAIVEAMLPDDGAELATLLREVEAWIIDHGVGAIRWHLDGRTYIMEGDLAATWANVLI